MINALSAKIWENATWIGTCWPLDKGDFVAARELIARGADINATSRMTADSTLLWLAVNSAGGEISKNFQDLAAGVAEYLETPKRDHTAKRNEQLRFIRALIELKADINKPSNGSTPLRIAVHWNDLEVVNLLLANGANPSAETFSILSNTPKTHKGHFGKMGYYNTILHEAAQKGSVPIVEALLAAGADPNRTDQDGKTPLAIAQEKGCSELVELLKDRTSVESE